MRGLTLLIAVSGGALIVASALAGRLPTISSVETAFASHGQPLRVYAIKPYPVKSSWARLRPHLRRVFISSRKTADTFGFLQVWVFDSAASARLAQAADPMLAERRRQKTVIASSTETSGFAHRQANIVVTGSYERWPATAAALAQLR